MIIYIPDRTEEKKAISRTTHLAVSAHQDDIAIISFPTMTLIRRTCPYPVLSNCSDVITANTAGIATAKSGSRTRQRAGKSNGGT